MRKNKNNLDEINLKLIRAITELTNENQKFMNDKMSSFLRKTTATIDGCHKPQGILEKKNTEEKT
ncbi:MAG: hypothetical protein PF549_02560 [Patescibacteria group bacterium]|jgi:hypothetical protein|nr:hypothetical protein [Patescibacteria group bacterium]